MEKQQGGCYVKSGFPTKPRGIVVCGQPQSNKAFMGSGERHDCEWVETD